MGSTKRGFAGSKTFPHGIHPPERKNFSANVGIEIIPPPEKVTIPLHQNVGAPCISAVKAKQKVLFGEMVGKAGGFVSAPLHSPISGKVLKPVFTTLPTGRRMQAISIKAEGEQLSGDALWNELFGGDWPVNIDEYDSKTISETVNSSGILGLGGAAFPTHVKLISNKDKPVNTYIINGCECEPYLTPDYRLMLEAPGPIVAGTLLAAKAVGANDIFIGIEDNKPEAIEVMKNAAAGTGIKIAVLQTKYPQGSEKQLIMAITKRAVPLGGLPMDVGVAVSNVGSAAAIAQAVIRGKPLTHRIVSITGGGVSQPKNLLAPIGISYAELINHCGGLTKDAARVISGGPMMGFAFSNLEAPTTKGTSGVTILTHSDIQKAEETSCVRCGKCVDACPMNLVPSRLALASRYKNVELAEKYNIMGCFECGSCAYTCPASIPIVQLIRVGKSLVMASKNK